MSDAITNQLNTETGQNQVSKYTTLRVLKTRSNRIRRYAKKRGFKIEIVTDQIIELGFKALEQISVNS